MFDELTVTPEANGEIKVDALRDFDGEVKKWQEIAPLVYRAVNGQELLGFRRDEQGRLQLVPNFPAVVYQRASFLHDQRYNQPVLIGCLIIMALTLLFWPAGALVRRHYHQRLEMDAPQRRGRLWIRLVCALNIIFVVAMLQTFSNAEAGVFNEKLDLHINLIQAVGVLGALGTVLVLIACLRSWRDRNQWVWAKVWNLLVLLACIGLTWFVLYWNLLDFSKNY
jgi:hypothetical protein